MVLPTYKVIGILGNVISFGLFLSPLPTFMTIVSKKAVEQFSPLPYLATLLSCLVSIIYGLPTVHRHSILVLTMNGIGALIESVWILVFWVFSTHRLRLQILGILAVELVVVGAVLAGVLGGTHTHDKRTEIAGILSVIFNSISYVAPLSIMISNGIGAVLSVIQLGLYFVYCTTPRDKSEVVAGHSDQRT